MAWQIAQMIMEFIINFSELANSEHFDVMSSNL